MAEAATLLARHVHDRQLVQPAQPPRRARQRVAPHRVATVDVGAVERAGVGGAQRRGGGRRAAKVARVKVGLVARFEHLELGLQLERVGVGEHRRFRERRQLAPPLDVVRDVLAVDPDDFTLGRRVERGAEISHAPPEDAREAVRVADVPLDLLQRGRVLEHLD